MSNLALKELEPLISELGRLWAQSPYRPRPPEESLLQWDSVLETWSDSNLPIIFRSGGRRDEETKTADGRDVWFSDNTPAHWSFSLALKGEVPPISAWMQKGIVDVPRLFTKQHKIRNLNKEGWKICHIESVSDKRRKAISSRSSADVIAAFKRLMSPRNMFLIPKDLAGAGELPSVISAVREFEDNKRNRGW